MPGYQFQPPKGMLAIRAEQNFLQQNPQFAAQVQQQRAIGGGASLNYGPGGQINTDNPFKFLSPQEVRDQQLAWAQDEASQSNPFHDVTHEGPATAMFAILGGAAAGSAMGGAEASGGAGAGAGGGAGGGAAIPADFAGDAATGQAMQANAASQGINLGAGAATVPSSGFPGDPGNQPGVPPDSMGGDSGFPGDPGAQPGGFDFPGSPSIFSPPQGNQFMAGIERSMGNLKALPWAGISGATSIGSSIYGLDQASKIRKQSNAIGNKPDPLDAWRQQYAQQLAALQANPGSVTNMPGYQFGMDQGSQALQRQMAQGGYTQSGNEKIALQNYGQKYSSDFLNNEMARLAQLSGFQFPSTDNSRTSLQGNISASDIASRSLASMGYGMGQFGRQLQQ